MGIFRTKETTSQIAASSSDLPHAGMAPPEGGPISGAGFARHISNMIVAPR
jgi:hypothetical protein